MPNGYYDYNDEDVFKEEKSFYWDRLWKLKEQNRFTLERMKQSQNYAIFQRIYTIKVIMYW